MYVLEAIVCFIQTQNYDTPSMQCTHPSIDLMAIVCDHDGRLLAHHATQLIFLAAEL